MSLGKVERVPRSGTIGMHSCVIGALYGSVCGAVFRDVIQARPLDRRRSERFVMSCTLRKEADYRSEQSGRKRKMGRSEMWPTAWQDISVQSKLIHYLIRRPKDSVGQKIETTKCMCQAPLPQNLHSKKLSWLPLRLTIFGQLDCRTISLFGTIG